MVYGVTSCYEMCQAEQCSFWRRGAWYELWLESGVVRCGVVECGCGAYGVVCVECGVFNGVYGDVICSVMG